MTAFEYAGQNLFGPLNITSVDWDKDLDGYTSTAWGLYITVRDYAKFGYLFLNKGRWEDRQIVSEAWVEKSTKTDPRVKMWAAYGYLWHVNLPYRLQWNKSPVPLDSIPRDGYMAEGVLGQTMVRASFLAVTDLRCKSFGAMPIRCKTLPHKGDTAAPSPVAEDTGPG